eukprot:11531583-Alexandrium_andersonii.AAC.1
MGWKCWGWPRLRAPMFYGSMDDRRRFGWPLEKVVHARAQIACFTLDARYKSLHAAEEAPAEPREPCCSFPLPERKPPP